ncbi:MAG: hypothetical protein GXO99_08610 [Nitrospirae bacterium]|nr:hypothetical protein [Nitrospirota bacterium]
MMHGTGLGMGFGGFGLGWIFMIVFWVIIIIAIIYIVRYIFFKDGSGISDLTGQKENAEDILKKRLANGEITTKEYEEKLRILREGR